MGVWTNHGTERGAFGGIRARAGWQRRGVAVGMRHGQHNSARGSDQIGYREKQGANRRRERLAGIQLIWTAESS